MSRISTRYRRKLIWEESDELFPLIFNETLPRANSRVIVNNSGALNNDNEIEHVDFNNVLSEIVQKTKTLPSFSDETNISESNASLNNTVLRRTFIREDVINNSDKENNNDFEAFLYNGLLRIAFLM